MTRFEENDKNIMKAQKMNSIFGDISYNELTEGNPEVLRDYVGSFFDAYAGKSVYELNTGELNSAVFQLTKRTNIPHLSKLKTSGEKGLSFLSCKLKYASEQERRDYLEEGRGLIEFDETITKYSRVAEEFGRLANKYGMVEEVQGRVQEEVQGGAQERVQEEAVETISGVALANEDRHNGVMKRAEQRGGCWPGLVDYLFKRTDRFTKSLEGSLDVGFPQEIGEEGKKEYRTTVTYVLGKNFQDVILEPVVDKTIKEVMANAKGNATRNMGEVLEMEVRTYEDDGLDYSGRFPKTGISETVLEISPCR